LVGGGVDRLVAQLAQIGELLVVGYGVLLAHGARILWALPLLEQDLEGRGFLPRPAGREVTSDHHPFGAGGAAEVLGGRREVCELVVADDDGRCPVRGCREPTA